MIRVNVRFRGALQPAHVDYLLEPFITEARGEDINESDFYRYSIKLRSQLYLRAVSVVHGF